MACGIDCFLERSLKQSTKAGRDLSEHDSAYKLLFSHAEMVADLLRGFVKEPWVKEMDLATLERVGSSFVAEDLQDREGDVIWRLRFRGGWLYVYLLLEFQSTVDRFMALRMMVYVGLLYQKLIQEKELTGDGRLPAVLPVVLYNGGRPWNAPEEMRELIEQIPGGLERYQPKMRYLLLEESRYTDEELSSLRNLVAALFRLENSRDSEHIGEVIGLLVEWLKIPEHDSLRRAFAEWLRRGLLPARLPGVEIPEFGDLQEVKLMLAEHVKEWTQEWLEQGLQQGREQGREQGLQQGREQGREQGLQQGRAQMLLRQVERKFGSLAETQRQRILAASPDTLLEWAERLLFADRWEEVVKER
jgi:predicted transposase/invertase (TIGR01784 family)